jgi:hypothetical protein
MSLNIPVRMGVPFNNNSIKGFLERYSLPIPKMPPQAREMALLKMKLSPNWFYEFGSRYNDNKLRGDANLSSTAISNINFNPMLNTIGVRFRTGGKTYISPCTYPKFLSFTKSRSLGRYWNQYFKL